MRPFIESLEPRELLSASPLRQAPNPTIAADLAAIANNKAIIIRDRATGRAQIMADRARIPSTRATDLATLRADRIAIRQAHGNHDAVQLARGQLLIDQGRFRSDLAQLRLTIKADSTNLVNTLKADQAMLKADRLTLRNDRIAARG